jgi:hypothetical protein
VAHPENPKISRNPGLPAPVVWASLAGKDPRFLHRIGALFGLPIAEDKRDGAAVSVEADAQGFVVG